MEWYFEVKSLLTKKEITLLVFALGGLILGFAIDRFVIDGSSKADGVGFPAPKVTASVGEQDSVRRKAKVDKPAGPIDINHASEEELTRICGIGPVLAHRIYEDRKANGIYRSKKEITRVKGIGPATLKKIEGQIIIVK